jgi:prepilin-type N-terminal cleavage/methylation domain-containing protein
VKSSDRSGFTLLEVLAAVAILAIAYMQLGSSGVMGLRHEGEARRRIAASLAADSVLTEIEGSIEAGTVPPAGEQEHEENGLRISVKIDPFTLEVPDEQPADGHRIGQAKSRLGGDAATQPLAGPSLLGGERGAPPPLRRIEVRVAWDEGFGEMAVTRVTYALDAEAASGTLGALAQAAQQANPQAQKKPPAGAPKSGPPLDRGPQ